MNALISDIVTSDKILAFRQFPGQGWLGCLDCQLSWKHHFAVQWHESNTEFTHPVANFIFIVRYIMEFDCPLL